MAKVEKTGFAAEEKILANKNPSENNGLLLYSYHHCFYTQKVLMALYEKKIPFTTKWVDITKKEQYQLWYLKINPRGEVPVLKDGIKYIPDSERIIQYLEDNFSNGDHSRLIPLDQGPDIRQKIIEYHTDIDNIPSNVLTLGSLFNNEFCMNLRYPFILPFVHKFLRVSEKSGSKALRDIAANLPEYSECLLQKAEELEKRNKQITDKTEFFKVLQQVDDLLDKVENELSAHDKGNHFSLTALDDSELYFMQIMNVADQADWWLCMDRFTIADISLTMLLDRLSRVGLEAHFWGHGKRPNIGKYYRRVQKRDSYRKTVPSFVTDLSIFLRNKAPLILSVSLLTVISVMVGSFIYFRK